MLSCGVIEQYCRHYGAERLPGEADAYSNYWNTGWRQDYWRPGFQLYYTYRLFERRERIARAALNKYLGVVPDWTTVVSVGCGPGAELAAAHDVLWEFPNVRFLGIDCEGGWERLYRAWTTRVGPSTRQFYWQTRKVTDEEMLVNLLRAENASVVIFSYFVRDFAFYVNPSRLMERVPTLQHVFIFDHPSVLRILDKFWTNANIYYDEYLDDRTHGDSWTEKVQVRTYSPYEICTTLGFAIMLGPRGELALFVGNFKNVERSVVSSHRYQYQTLVPFTAIHYGASFHNDFINLVAPYLAHALNISVQRAYAAVTYWCNDNLNLPNRHLRTVSTVMDGLLAIRDGESMSRFYQFRSI